MTEAATRRVFQFQMTEEQLEDQKRLLLDLLAESYDTFAWHGPNLTQALSGVDAKHASWRPPSESIWNIHEIVIHVGNVMYRCAAGVARKHEDLPPNRVDRDRFPLPDLQKDDEWKREMDFLQQSYELLRRGVLEITPVRLQEVSPERAYAREWRLSNHVYGVALHNIYHAAQIVSLRKRQHTWIELS